MNVVLALVLFAGLVAGQKYTTKYDNVDLDEILNNERLYQKYYDCLMDKGKCTPDGKELKDDLPEAIKTDCAKCSEKQKSGSDKVLKFMLSKKKADYEELEKKFDPQQTYRKRHHL